MAKGGGPEPQSPNQDNAFDILWNVALLLVGILVAWYFGRHYIAVAIFHVRMAEIVLIQIVLDPWIRLAAFFNFTGPKLIDLQQSVKFIHENYGNIVSFADLTELSSVVGGYLRYPIIIIFMILATVLHFTGIARRFRHTYDTNSLKAVEAVNWPQITPVVKLDLIKEDINQGPWAMAMSPMMFCKKHNLLEIIKQGDKNIAILRRGAAYRILSLQLGPRWRGPAALPIHQKALFAIFAACMDGDKVSADLLKDQVSGTDRNGRPNFDGVEELMRKHMNAKEVRKIANLHGYVTTTLSSMLASARSSGVLATSEFLWLKPIDRRLWYVLSSVGRPTPIVEVCGVFAHWLAEKKIGLPLMVPMVEEAVRGLELSISEIIYKTEE